MQSLEGEGDGFWRNELEASVAGVQREREGVERRGGRRRWKGDGNHTWSCRLREAFGFNCMHNGSH